MFTDSLARLTGEEQKAAKTTAFDLQLNPASPGMSLHKLDKARDKNFRSVRVGSDIRLIVHRTQGSLLLCYVDHHDKAYDWAERRKLETHPKTGAAQLVEIRETVQEVVIPTYIDVPKAAPIKAPLFAQISDDELLSYGVPFELAVRHSTGNRGHTADTRRPPPGRGSGGIAGVGDRREAARGDAHCTCGQSLRSPRRIAPVPRDGERRGA